jgi:SAM-dependent methyltransferase
MSDYEKKKELVQAPPKWMYEFDLGDGLKTPLLADELRTIHETREKMIFPLIDQLFPKGLHSNKCLDVACNEGYFSHLLYQRGAWVKGIDIRPVNIERALAIRELYDFAPQRLIFEVQDFFENQDAANTYGIVLFLGLFYHIENPMLALRRLHTITQSVCVVETQMTRQNTPVVSGWGQTSVFLELPASLAIYQEQDAEANNLASFHTLSFIPNAAAVHLMLIAAGFSKVIQIPATPAMNPQYIHNDRGVFFAFK